MSARFRAVAAITTIATGAVLALAGRADALPAPITPGASAYSAAAGTGSASLDANLYLTGALGDLLDGLVTPIVNTALNPLVAALHGTVNSVVDAALGASSSTNAGSPNQMYGTAPAAFPSDLTPSPCKASGAQPCYQVSGATTVTAAPLANVGLSLISGYTQQVPSSADATNPIFARASVANPSVAVLPGITSLVNPLVSAGLVNAKANCPNDGAVGAVKPATAPTASVSASGVNLLGGLVTLDVLNGQVANLKVNNIAYASLAVLPVLTIGVVTVSPYGTSVMVAIPISVSQILNGLGLPGSAVSQLLGFSPTSTLSLKVIVGPAADITSTTAKAWGLGIGVDLAGSLGFNLLGLVGATVNLRTGISGGNYGNLVDLRLAQTLCKSGTNTPPVTPPVPPALV
jgi:hypothetical protein